MDRIAPPKVTVSPANLVRKVLVRRRPRVPVIPTLFAALLASGALAAQPSAALRKARPQLRPLPVRAAAASQAPASHPGADPAKFAPVPQPPAAPEMPQWPVNGPPTQPSVTWNGHALRIDAMNASLSQILKEVSADTGAKVEGFGGDERIFGDYGPADPRDVLAQLLDGTDYNVIIVGSHAADESLRIVLSNKPKGPPPPEQNQPPAENNEDYSAEEPPPYTPPQPYPPQPAMRPGLNPGLNPGQAPRTPQQIYQEMQQREEQLRQQQGLQQTNPPD